jgi:hypothetical protein
MFKQSNLECLIGDQFINDDGMKSQNNANY